ncbi:MAG: dipeptidase [Thermomicrobiales bacterium]|nr:dipeptidase [Thermomicrobiales bacterium]
MEAKRVHDDAIVIDATCPLMRRHDLIHWWIEGGATAAAPSVGGGENPGETLKALGAWLDLIERTPEYLLVTRASDIERAKAEGRFGIIFHFQGVTPLEDDLNLVDAFKALGVGMIQLSYNVKNRVGDGCEERTDAGLSRFGLKLIERMNRARVIVDCSHTGYTTTMEAISASSAPVVFSHAGAKAVKNSNRNITDEQIKAVAATGGLVGAVGFPAFVSDDPVPTLDQFIDHIVYMADLVGVDHVGLGIDYFEGQVPVAAPGQMEAYYEQLVGSGTWRPENYPPPPYHYPQGIETPRGFPNLTAGLLRRGFSEAETAKIMGGNWLRVFRVVWGE